MKNKLLVLLAVLLITVGCANMSSNNNVEDQLPLEPDFSDGRELVRDDTIYINGIGLNIMESFPIQVSITLDGDLPTPCNAFAYDVAMPNENNEIHIDVYTLIDPAATCIAMLEPFSETIPIPMEGAADGEYTIWINGEKAGDFNFPGG